jgi:segregation and condensation protein B
MARRKKGKDPAEPVETQPQAEAPPEESAVEATTQPHLESAPDDLPEETTQVDAVVPPIDDAVGDLGAVVDNPMAGDTEKLHADASPVPPDEPMATVTDISSAMEGQPEEGAEAAAEETGAEGEGQAEAVDPGRLEAIIEALLFASDKALGLADLKRLVGERDSKKIAAAIESLTARRSGSGIVVTSAAGGWNLRTNPELAPWVGKLLAGKPVRLSRAMLETMAIVAYRQPVTRPEIDDIRGVDCGPVLKTLLDRGLVRVIGKKEEVGRPMLYGTTPEFLRTFNLRDLTELPTLREFHELGAEEKAKVDAEHGAPAGATEVGADATNLAAAAQSVFTPHPPLTPDPEEDDGLIEDLEKAAEAAARASGAAAEPPVPTPPDRSS